MAGLSVRGYAVAWTMTALVAAGMAVAAPAQAATSASAGPARGADASSGPAPWRSWYASSAIGEMWSVAAFSTKSIWAGGTISGNQLFVIRWNGARWARVTIPGASGFSNDVVAGSSASDVWVFGTNAKGAAKAFHWDGAHWHTIAMPVASLAVPVVVRATSVWITGEIECKVPPTPAPWKCVTPVYRWNGRTWRKSSIGEWVRSLATAHGTVMAAGVVPHDDNINGPIGAFRWTGAKWAAVSMPHPQGAEPNIGMDSPNDVWISSAEPNVAKDYELHWNGHRWRTIRVIAVAQGVFPPLVVPDGHGGAWLGYWAHYTGGKWVTVSYAMPPAPGHEIIGTALTPVPGASDTYVQSAYAGKFGGSTHPAVYFNGPLP